MTVSTSSRGPMPASVPDGPVAPRACVHWAYGVGVASGLGTDHSTAAARNYASPAGGAPASVGRSPPALQRALRGHGHTLGWRLGFAPTPLRGMEVEHS